jgi:benzoyl-CoA-dihydrodiol lyase
LIDFRTEPAAYKHWKIEYQGNVARLAMDVAEDGGLFDGYELKLNSYDLGVDIELADIVQRMRFEHPEVGAVILHSGKERVFCAGANIRMLGGAEHAHKVNFCKFTNETRNTYEAAAEDSGQTYIAAIRGACAGGGYELALACEEIYMVDDASTSVALPEVPLLAVLPGTGGLTRVTDKRKVRRDIADVFCSMEEGAKGKKAEQWNLVDKVLPNTKFDDFITERAAEIAKHAKRPEHGIELGMLERTVHENGAVEYQHVRVDLSDDKGIATVTISGPVSVPDSAADVHRLGAEGWALATVRQLDDAILHLRFNELQTGVVIFKTEGDPESVAAYEKLLHSESDDWLCREILLYWKRVLKRIDLTAKSLVAQVEHGSCFAGMLAELLFAVDRSYMMEDEFEDDDRPEATLLLTEGNFGTYLMSNGLTRLQTRFIGEPERVDKLRQSIDKQLPAAEAAELQLVTFAYDDIDWFDEIRVFLEERCSFSPDAMTGMEANLRFAGPETMETRIFGRLTAWQNWIFQRPNAVGEHGALQRYGTGTRAEFDRRRV